MVCLPGIVLGLLGLTLYLRGKRMIGVAAGVAALLSPLAMMLIVAWTGA